MRGKNSWFKAHQSGFMFLWHAFFFYQNVNVLTESLKQYGTQNGKVHKDVERTAKEKESWRLPETANNY